MTLTYTMNKLAPGFKKIKTDKPISIEALYNFLLGIFKERYPNHKWTGIQHYEGFFGDGTPYEYWVVNGTMMGRGAYELFLKSLKEYGDNIDIDRVIYILSNPAPIDASIKDMDKYTDENGEFKYEDRNI